MFNHAFKLEILSFNLIFIGTAIAHYNYLQLFSRFQILAFYWISILLDSNNQYNEVNPFFGSKYQKGFYRFVTRFDLHGRGRLE